MSAPARKPIDAGRRSIYGKIEVAKKALGLDDDTYRGILRTRYGKASRTELSRAELGDLVEHFRSLGFRPTRAAPKRARAKKLAEGEELAKVRALWLSLYHLAEVRDPSEGAILAFAQRMGIRVDALQWIDSAGADRLIRALRGWCERVGFAQPLAADVERFGMSRERAGLEPRDTGHAAKALLIKAQWKALADAGAFRQRIFANLGTWLATRYGVTYEVYLEPEAADAAIEELGAWLRRATAEKESKA